MTATWQLTPEKALVFRITHRDNIPWILDRGLHCSTSAVRDPDFVTIGIQEIIGRRNRWPVPIPPGGTLADYVPFYFTPLSPMLLNIKTGYHGVTQRGMEEIVLIVSSLHQVLEHGLRFLFTDRHAKLFATSFFQDLSELHHVPWDLLQARDFRRDPEYPDKVDRYQAEALVYQHVPVEALMGFVCYNEDLAAEINRELAKRELSLEAKAFPGWFFQ